MTQTLAAHRRKRACKICKKTGARNCAAAKLGQSLCQQGECLGMQAPLVDPKILLQRDYLTRHLCPRTTVSAKPTIPSKISCRSIRPRRCRNKNCRSAVPCPHGQCFASFATVMSEAQLHEYAGVHGARDGEGNYWSLAGLATVGERPHPGRLNDRDDMVRELRSKSGRG
jgi:hypothetical protein